MSGGRAVLRAPTRKYDTAVPSKLENCRRKREKPPSCRFLMSFVERIMTNKKKSVMHFKKTGGVFAVPNSWQIRRSDLIRNSFPRLVFIGTNPVFFSQTRMTHDAIVCYCCIPICWERTGAWIPRETSTCIYPSKEDAAARMFSRSNTTAVA